MRLPIPLVLLPPLAAAILGCGGTRHPGDDDTGADGDADADTDADSDSDADADSDSDADSDADADGDADGDGDIDADADTDGDGDADGECGDGRIDAGEDCDDGNDLNTDACLDDCTAARCSDGFVQAGVEACDDGNVDTFDDCIACVQARCGDGFVNRNGEVCDDADTPATCWACQAAYWEQVGRYAVNAGPAWGDDPPTYSCVEACGVVFGAGPSYGCSTIDGTLTHMAYVSGYADGAHCIAGGEVADTYELGDHYDCGAQGCSYSAYVADNCGPESINFCWQPWRYVGQYTPADGPRYTDNPVTYSCVEACALNFGGVASDYACSTNAVTVDHLGYVSGWADGSHCVAGGEVAEDYKLNTNYNCGAANCAYSAWVSDNCPAETINHCWIQ